MLSLNVGEMLSKYQQLKADRIGSKHETNNCGTLTIMDYISNENCTVQFADGTTLYNIKYGDIKRGEVKNKFHPTVFGIGFIGQGNYTTNSKCYNTWALMIQRCYYRDSETTYKDCFVHKHWHNFQNFAEWYYKFYDSDFMQKWHLDKDLLVKGNKIYGPDTCCFLPQRINKIISCNLKKGLVGSELLLYQESKKLHLKKVIVEFQEQMVQKVYDTLINYEF